MAFCGCTTRCHMAMKGSTERGGYNRSHARLCALHLPIRASRRVVFSFNWTTDHTDCDWGTRPRLVVAPLCRGVRVVIAPRNFGSPHGFEGKLPNEGDQKELGHCLVV